jgi:hypothetical protein
MQIWAIVENVGVGGKIKREGNLEVAQCKQQ